MAIGLVGVFVNLQQLPVPVSGVLPKRRDLRNVELILVAEHNNLPEHRFEHRKQDRSHLTGLQPNLFCKHAHID
jgi:hypothetical protein